jgi:hypothetical protein
MAIRQAIWRALPRRDLPRNTTVTIEPCTALREFPGLNRTKYVSSPLVKT